MAENKKVTEATEKATKPGTPKVPFAEQLSIRMKPYMEALTEEGIKSFDEFIRSINLHAFDEINPEVLNSIDDGVHQVLKEVDDLKEVKESTEVVEPDKSKDNSVGESAINDIKQEIVSLRDDLHSSREEDKEKEAELSRREQELDKQDQERESRSVKDKKQTDATFKRITSDVSSVKKKVHEPFLVKLLKGLAYIFLGGWFFHTIWPVIKPILKAEVEALGLDKIADNIIAWLDDNFPGLMETLTGIHDVLSKVLSFVSSIYDNVNKYLVPTVKEVGEGIREAVGITDGDPSKDKAKSTSWDKWLREAGYLDAATEEDRVEIQQKVWKEHGGNSVSGPQNMAYREAITALNKEHALNTLPPIIHKDAEGNAISRIEDKPIVAPPPQAPSSPAVSVTHDRENNVDVVTDIFSNSRSMLPVEKGTNGGDVTILSNSSSQQFIYDNKGNEFTH